MTLLRLEDHLVQPNPPPPYKRVEQSRLFRAMSSQIPGWRRQSLEVTASSLPSKTTTLETLEKNILYFPQVNICLSPLNCHRPLLLLSSSCSYQIFIYIGNMLLSFLFSRLNDPRFSVFPCMKEAPSLLLASWPFTGLTPVHLHVSCNGKPRKRF